MDFPAWTWVPPTAPGAWQFFLLGALAMLIIGVGKAGFGASIAMLAMPMMIYACDNAPLATGILLPVLILSDYVAVILWRGQWDLRTVRLLLPGTLAGVALAWGMLVWVQDSRAAMTRADAFLKLTVGLIALGFVVLQVLRALRGRPLTVSPGLAHATGVGAAAGATSTFAHAAGPVMAIYLLGQRMEPGKYVATTAVYFWLVNQIKLAPYFHLGMIDLSSLGFSLLLAPAAVAGTFLGVYLQRRLGQRQFTGVVYTLLAAAGVDLCLRGGWALGHSLRLW